jgi:hypothetical protein
MYGIWLFVAAFTGVVTAIVLTEVLRLSGVVEAGESSYQRAINVIWLVVFVAVAAVPFVFRKRFIEREPNEEP